MVVALRLRTLRRQICAIPCGGVPPENPIGRGGTDGKEVRTVRVFVDVRLCLAENTAGVAGQRSVSFLQCERSAASANRTVSTLIEPSGDESPLTRIACDVAAFTYGNEVVTFSRSLETAASRVLGMRLYRGNGCAPPGRSLLATSAGGGATTRRKLCQLRAERSQWPRFLRRELRSCRFA
jgi:hypothetical protein